MCCLLPEIAGLSDCAPVLVSAGTALECRGLEALLNQRRKLLQYLRRSKFDKYAVLISRWGSKDSYGPQDPPVVALQPAPHGGAK